jgi:nicotinate-nucleotide pyrophosphorylase (carboxylating)
MPQQLVEKESSLYQQILKLIDVALQEDIRTGDLTSIACVGHDATISGRLLMKQGGRVAGLPFLSPLFKKIDDRIEVELAVDEGSEHKAGTLLATISGPARGIFSAERVALNLLQHASGIATTTAEFVERVEGTHCDILDTRKTLPGLRCLEKYAVQMGGGKNHRWGLDDRFIIKKNHIWFIAQESRHPIIESVRRVRAYREGLLVGVEVTSLDMVKEALEARVDIIRLDNLAISTVRKAVAIVKGRAYVEVSGEDITTETIRSYADTGVNGISLAAITSSVRDLNISLRF